MLLSEAIKDFTERSHLSPDSTRTYSQDLNQALKYIGDKPVRDIVPLDLVRFLNDLDRNPDIQSPYTYNKYVKSLRALFSWLLAHWEIEKSPAEMLTKKREPKAFKEVKAMPELKLQRLLSYVSENGRGWDPREEATVRTLADTGLRPKSVVHIQWKDVDLTKGEIIVRHQKSRNEPHTVAIGSACKRALTAWKLRQGGRADGYVFSPDSHIVASSALSQYFRRLCKKAGIGSWGPYSLRHRLGLRAVRQYGVVTAARILNDTPEIVAQHYARESEEYVLQAMRAMTSDLLVKGDDSSDKSETSLQFKA